MPAAGAWSLDPQLAADTAQVGALELCELRLLRDANYPWLVLVLRRAGVSEIIDLAAADRPLLMTEIAEASRALRTVTHCDKLNVAAIGNVVAQLHVHIVARRRNDAAWPRPVWGVAAPAAYDPASMAAFIAAVRGEMRIG